MLLEIAFHDQRSLARRTGGGVGDRGPRLEIWAVLPDCSQAWADVSRLGIRGADFRRVSDFDFSEKVETALDFLFYSGDAR